MVFCHLYHSYSASIFLLSAAVTKAATWFYLVELLSIPGTRLSGISGASPAVWMEHCVSSWIGIIISPFNVAVGTFRDCHNAHPMKVLVKNPISVHYLGELEIQLAMGLFQPRAEVAY